MSSDIKKCPFCGSKSVRYPCGFLESYRCGTRLVSKDGRYSTGNECDKASYRQELTRLRAENDELKKYEQCLEDAAQRLQDVLPIGKVKAIGLLEVSAGIDELISENVASGYSYGEIEAACGADVARHVRDLCDKRRAAISAVREA